MLSYDDVTTIGGSHVTDDSSLGGHLGLRNVCIQTILIEELILYEDIFVCTCHSISYKK